MGKSGGRKKKGSSNQVSVDKTNPSNKINSNSESNINGKSSATPIVNGSVDLDSSIFLKRAHELKEEGNKRFQSKDFAGALEQYEIALKLTPKTHPDRAVFHSNRAACMIQMKPIDYESVISECSLALQVQPNFARALLRRARAFEAVGKPDMAALDVQALLAADPNHRDALDIAHRLRTALGPRPETQQDLHSRPSPAALGASAVRGAPIAGLGPCLPARPIQKKPAPAPAPAPAPTPALAPANPKPPLPVASEQKSPFPKLSAKPVSAASAKELAVPSSSPLPAPEAAQSLTAVLRALKLVYDHDIRLAQMPLGCTFRVLREIVAKRFPSSKSVLVKYKDSDGDLVTITSTAELRTAEAGVGDGGVLRLHVVEVSPDQEPPLPDEEEEEAAVEEEKESALEEEAAVAVEEEKETPVEKESEEKEAVEMDEWLLEFAQLFRTHVGIDPEAHVELHEVGMEVCSEALEEAVTSEAAQTLFDKAASKFQEVAALAFFNWGNVHMCAARKRIPLDDSAAPEVVASQLRAAYEWVKDKYSLAREKYEEALAIKPDFYEGLLALGQQQFEMAKLHWSYAIAGKADLSQWNSALTLDLFDSAQEKMRVATAMWERLEEQRPTDDRRKDEASAAEDAAVMRSQIHLFWGNMLFERSQVEYNLSLAHWRANLDAALHRFKLAGASETDIATVLKNHCSNDANKEASSQVETDVGTPVLPS